MNNPTWRGSGWVTFAGVLGLVAGFYHVVSGLAAVADDETLKAQAGEVLFDIDIGTWGWTWLVLGVVQLGISVAILRRVPIGSVLGIAWAALSATLACFSIFTFPLWATVVVLLNVLVLYGLIGHGDEFDGTHVRQPGTLTGVPESPTGW